MRIRQIPPSYQDIGIELADPGTAIGQRFPDFMIVGPWRTGTTWLHETLLRHPQVAFSSIKETYYFSHLRRKTRQDVPRDFDWYLSLFEQKNGTPSDDVLIGEASATYATHLSAEDIRFIYALNPDIKIIMGVRDPIQRAWSHIRMNIASEPEVFADLTPDEQYEKALSRKYIIDGGRYADQVDRWCSVIPPKQFYLFNFAELTSDPVRAFTGVCAFLDINSSELSPELILEKGRVNASDEKPVPPKVLQFLAQAYESDRMSLRERFGLELTDAEEEIKQRPIVIVNTALKYSETFVGQHIMYLGAKTKALSDYTPLTWSRDGLFLIRPLRKWMAQRNLHKLKVELSQLGRRLLIEYGPTAVKMLPVLEAGDFNTVVHFHGFDAHRTDIVSAQKEQYKRLFTCADALIVVSSAMRHALIELGAPPDKIHHIVCGIEKRKFPPSDVRKNGPVFFACGRFVPKKAPDQTIRAFHLAWQHNPEIRLRFAGTGALFDACKALVEELGMSEVVTFLGVISQAEVARELQDCRAFIQHSVVAPDGDSEGTPVSILEAGCAAVPVIATRHAGIGDVIEHGVTGLLCAEHDVKAMAGHIALCATDPERAFQMGQAGREVVIRNYTIESSIAKINKLWC